MKIGALVFLTEQSGNPGAIAREAENLGFETFFVAEHMVVPSTYTTHYPRSRDGKVPEYYARLIDPFVALAIAADATSRIKIGTAICLLPQRDVIETAKVTASIDLYSKGRRRQLRTALATSARIGRSAAQAVERRRRQLCGRDREVPAGKTRA
jgi:alkanesulfonate monooxygenase SsuD/methylene tetrahydromethanopterin reductase-like flavin-dependent oxidoreductase (luciferase family)